MAIHTGTVGLYVASATLHWLPRMSSCYWQSSLAVVCTLWDLLCPHISSHGIHKLTLLEL